MSSDSDEGAPESAAQATTARSFSGWVNGPANRALAVFLVVGLIVAFIEVLKVPILADWLYDMELRVQDCFLEWKSKLPKATLAQISEDRLLIVRLDKESLRRLGLSDQQSLPLKYYALLLSKLRQAGAQVIGVDLSLDESGGKADGTRLRADQDGGTDSPDNKAAHPATDDSEALARELKLSNNLVLASRSEPAMASSWPLMTAARHAPQTPDALFLKAIGMDSGSVGNAATLVDADGLVRKAALTFDEFGPSVLFYKSFGLRIAEKWFGSSAVVDEPGRVYVRDRIYPSSFRINYLGPPHTFRMVPFWRALDWEKHYAHNGLFATDSGESFDAQPSTSAHHEGQSFRPANPFANKIILVGLFDEEKERGGAEASDSDLFYLTPVSAQGSPMSDVELEANIVSNIIDGNQLTEPQGWEYLLIIALVSLMFGRILGLCGKHFILYLSILLGMTCLWMAVTFYALLVFHLLLPSVVPILAVAIPSSVIVLLDHFFVARRERTRRVRLFRSLAAKPLAQEIERSLLAELGLEGKRMTVSVLACQLRDFAIDSENQPPEELLQKLNECLAVIMTSIGEHHGIVERIWNCGVIGLWGAPIGMPVDDQASHLVDCVGDIQARLSELKYDAAAERFGFTCGISTGEAVCGTINAFAKDSILMQYGALGAAVELAMELEGLNATYGTVSIIAKETVEHLTGKMQLRQIDRRVVGIDQNEQEVFELISVSGSLPAVFDEAMALFGQARQAFDEGKFKAAEDLFATVLNMVPGDRPTILMLNRCKEFRETGQTVTREKAKG